VGNASVPYLVNLAWELNKFQLATPPPSPARFDIVAKVPPDTSKHDFHLMLQRLLTERIGLMMHHEARQQDVYEMTIAKGGPKLKTAEPAAADPLAKSLFSLDKNGNPQLTPGVPAGIQPMNIRGVMHLLGRLQNAAQIALNFQSSGAAERPVIDKTALSGFYDYDVAYTLDRPGGAASREASNPLPFFPEAVERELGLKLEAKKAPWDVIVIDRFNPVPIE
jgi:uncharacterized protein (TIGR03435 family)